MRRLVLLQRIMMKMTEGQSLHRYLDTKSHRASLKDLRRNMIKRRSVEEKIYELVSESEA